MFVQMEDRVIRHQEPTTQESWKSIWHCHLMPKFGEMPIHLITKPRILDYREELQKRHAPSTCNHIIAKLQGVLSYAVEKEKLAAVPKIGRLKIPSAAEKDPYTDEEMGLLLAAAEGDEVGILVLLLSLDAGLRRNEMLALRWCDLDLKNNEIHVKHSAHRRGLKCTKGKKSVAVPMRARLKAELAKARKDRKLTDHIFQGERNAWMSESAFRNYMRALAAKAGVEWRGFHKGKHTFITLLLEKGATLNELQLLARHKHASTTEGYMHVRNAAKAMRAGIARLDDPEPDPAPVPGPVKSVLRIVKS
ncbi:tyrosine-type recombinase/integrase [Nannocystis radixulma]|uniref:Tyrosine-type recombinase/integrase n=1 Tax=Nannocystis radixulma TaxID=2995305 RepID=A0ABT5BKU5_9BACT|nr:tyrosine-type recombinase/integrase [Nannocystis radixulma]MDC0674769.1 tyrosine-type recombinase/integrase [Nannocystis radixulma]